MLFGLLSLSATVARRQSGAAYVYVSGLLLNLAGILMWQVWGPQSMAGFVAVNALCLAVGAVVWTLIGKVFESGTAFWKPQHNAKTPHPRPSPARGEGGRVAAAYAGRRPAALRAPGGAGALALLAPLPVLTLFFGLLGPDAVQSMESVRLGGPVACAALGLAAVAMLVCTWDRTARFPLWGLYLAGLTGIGIELASQPCPPMILAWQAALLLAPWVLVSAIVARVLSRLGPSARWSIAWYQPAQAALVILVAAAAAWIAIDVRFDAAIASLATFGSGFWGAGLECLRRVLPPRMAGPLATAILFPATLLIAGASGEIAAQPGNRRRSAWPRCSWPLRAGPGFLRQSQRLGCTAA